MYIYWRGNASQMCLFIFRPFAVFTQNHIKNRLIHGSWEFVKTAAPTRIYRSISNSAELSTVEKLYRTNFTLLIYLHRWPKTKLNFDFEIIHQIKLLSHRKWHEENWYFYKNMYFPVSLVMSHWSASIPHDWMLWQHILPSIYIIYLYV